MVNIGSAAVAALLLVLDYLLTVNLSGLLTPERAVIWPIGINVLTIILRQIAKPQVTQTTVTPDGGQG